MTYEYIPDGPKVDGPSLDDLDQEVCEDCNEVKSKGTACPCTGDAPDAADHPDCDACDGDGQVRRSDGRTTNTYPCDACGGTGVAR